MRQGVLADTSVRRYCSKKRDEITPILSHNPLGTRSGRRILRKNLLQEFLGRETASEAEMRSIFRAALRVLNEAVETEEEEEDDEDWADATEPDEEEARRGYEPETPETPSTPPTRRRRSSQSSSSVPSSSLDALRSTPRLTQAQQDRRRFNLEGLSRERLLRTYQKAYFESTNRRAVIDPAVQTEELIRAIMSMEDQLRSMRQ